MNENGLLDDETLNDRISEFKWYQPISFGGGVAAYPTGQSHLLNAFCWGRKKWQYIVQRNLPDIQGARVLDIGCNAGLFSIEMARMGAREVVAVDSKVTWPPFPQQAELVKEALEARCNTKYNVRFIDRPMTEIPDLDLGTFDLVVSLCSLYYLPEDEMLNLLNYFRETECKCVLIQANNKRDTSDKEDMTRASFKFLRSLVARAGYEHIQLDAPLFYTRPIVVAYHDKPTLLPMSRRDRLRQRLHRMF